MNWVEIGFFSIGLMEGFFAVGFGVRPKTDLLDDAVRRVRRHLDRFPHGRIHLRHVVKLLCLGMHGRRCANRNALSVGRLEWLSLAEERTGRGSIPGGGCLATPSLGFGWAQEALSGHPNTGRGSNST